MSPAGDPPPTTVTLTGTGVPLPWPGRAGPGTLVRHGDLAVQVDAGRGTTLRLAEAGVGPHQLDALLLTHVHSDHVLDLAMARWIFQDLHPSGPLVVVAPEGPTARFARRALDAYDDDVAARTVDVLSGPPSIDLRAFVAPSEPQPVWCSPDRAVLVEAVVVHHEPVVGAVAYRISTPTGVVVISGDTRVCDEVEALSDGADVLVHEACRSRALADTVAGTSFEHVFSYHADSVAVGGLARRAGVGHLVLTHLIPPPPDDPAARAFEQDARQGGYTGPVTVGSDLCTVVARR